MNKAQQYKEKIGDELTMCAVNGMHLQEVNKAFISLKTECMECTNGHKIQVW